MPSGQVKRGGTGDSAGGLGISSPPPTPCLAPPARILRGWLRVAPRRGGTIARRYHGEPTQRLRGAAAWRSCLGRSLVTGDRGWYPCRLAALGGAPSHLADQQCRSPRLGVSPGRLAGERASRLTPPWVLTRTLAPKGTDPPGGPSRARSPGLSAQVVQFNLMRRAGYCPALRRWARCRGTWAEPSRWPAAVFRPGRRQATRPTCARASAARGGGCRRPPPAPARPLEASRSGHWRA